MRKIKKVMGDKTRQDNKIPFLFTYTTKFHFTNHSIALFYIMPHLFHTRPKKLFSLLCSDFLSVMNSFCFTLELFLFSISFLYSPLSLFIFSSLFTTFVPFFHPPFVPTPTTSLKQWLRSWTIIEIWFPQSFLNLVIMHQMLNRHDGLTHYPIITSLIDFPTNFSSFKVNHCFFSHSITSHFSFTQVIHRFIMSPLRHVRLLQVMIHKIQLSHIIEKKNQVRNNIIVVEVLQHVTTGMLQQHATRPCCNRGVTASLCCSMGFTTTCNKVMLQQRCYCKVVLWYECHNNGVTTTQQ